MNIRQVAEILAGDVLTPELDLERMVRGACGADLMSDVLVTINPGAVLLTGLCTVQAVRTAQLADLIAVVFVRGKRPGQEIVELARHEGIPVIVTHRSLFESCGRLYESGLRGSSEEPSK